MLRYRIVTVTTGDVPPIPDILRRRKVLYKTKHTVTQLQNEIHEK